MAKKRFAAAASARDAAPTSPQTWACGKAISAISDMNHKPLASPLAAESHESTVIGDEIGAASEDESMSPKKEASRTLPRLIGRKSQWSGMWAAVRRIDAARSSVRARQPASPAHSFEYCRICASVVCGLQTKCPGGLTAIITERRMLFGCRQL